ncbi:50S ribosomal protein L13, partial [Klebsiella pneumoniae]|nr:50S ribosomal protein L13 [Klebsiella pneumoniae]
MLKVEKGAVTGNKREEKMYHHYIGAIGGVKEASFEVRIVGRAERVMEISCTGMRPQGR